MIYGYGMMYQTLDRYVENNIDEIEHAFIPGLKWPDSYELNISDTRFWLEIQSFYGICVTKEDKTGIITVGDLKKKIAEGIHEDVCQG